MIWAAGSSCLRRSEISVSIASTSGTFFLVPSPPTRVLTTFLLLFSLVSFFDRVPFSPTCLGQYLASTFSDRCSLQLSLKQCSQLVRSPWALLALRCRGCCCGAQSSPGFASISCHESWSWATLGFLDPLVNCGYLPDPCFSPRGIWHPSSMQPVQRMEPCATSLLGEPEYSGLVGVALPATRWALFPGVC